MDTSTDYLGLHLPHPLMPGASPMVDDMGMIRRLEDSGAAAIVMHSLFEEQIEMEELAARHSLDRDEGSLADSTLAFAGIEDYRLNPAGYLEQLRRIKEAVSVPVIASLNGVSPGGWLNFASLLETAGADALELNIYYLATDPDESGEDVERQTVETVRSVREKLRIPVAVKLSPYYSALANFATRLDGAGADGLVLFNRFYQPDIDTDELRVARTLELSRSTDLRLRLRWLAILSSHIKGSLAVSGGVHSVEDVVKSVATGAHAVQVVSGLLKDGPERLLGLRRELEEWLERHEFNSLRELRGTLSHARTTDATAYERANYMEVLQGWKPKGRGLSTLDPWRTDSDGD